MRADGHEGDVGFWVVADALEEGGEFGGAFFVAVFAPFDGGVIHFVDDDDELVDALGFGEDGVLARLAALFETGFVFSLSCGNNQDSDICL